MCFVRFSGVDPAGSFGSLRWTGSRWSADIIYTRTTSFELAVFNRSGALFTASGNTLTASASGQYQYIGSTLVNCSGVVTLTFSR